MCHLGFQFDIGADAGLFDALHGLPELGQMFADGFDQGVDGRPALFQIALGHFPELVELRLGQGQELAVIGRQGISRQGLEGVGQPCLRLVQQGQLFSVIAAFMVQCGAHLGQSCLQVGLFLADDTQRFLQLRHPRRIGRRRRPRRRFALQLSAQIGQQRITLRQFAPQLADMQAVALPLPRQGRHLGAQAGTALAQP